MARDRSRDDDEDEDEVPRKKKRKRRDDDDDDRPRRKKDNTGSSGLILVMLGIGLLVVIGIAVGGFLLFRGAKKKIEQEVAEKQKLDAGPTQEDPFPRPKPKAGEAGSTKSPVGVGIPSLTSTVTQIVFAGGVDGYAAIVSNNIGGVGGGQNYDIVKTSTGKTVGRVQKSEATINGCAVSPDGNLLAVIGMKPLEGNPISLFSVTGGQLLKDFTPYSKVKDIAAPDLEWVSFVSKDQLLTINTGGGFDVWSVPEMKKAAGVPASLKAGSRIDVDHFTQSPKNFCLSMDSKTLAIYNGSGFTIYNTETTTEVAKTKDILQPGGAALLYASAFSPDGKRFACYYQIFAGKSSSTFLNVWDSKNGSLITAAGGSLKKGDKFPAGFAWWGSSHLVFWEGGIASGAVFSIDSRQFAGDVKTSIPGKFGTVPPNGQLWAVVGPAGYDPERDKGFLVHIDVPADLRQGVTFEISQEGLKTK